MRLLPVLAVAALLTAGCQFEVPIHGHGDGPLTAYDGGYFAMTDPPKINPPWYGSFGATLCATEPGTRIELKRVTWEAADDARPLAVKPWLRFVDRSTKHTTGFIGVAGLPWDAYDGDSMPGEYREGVAGAVITQSCAALDRARDAEFTELVLVIKTGKQGADIERAFIDYEVDGDPYRLVAEWRMITCGEAIEAREPDPEGLDDDACPPDRHEHYGDE